ncbi:MAG: hypothetical protein NPMRTH1_120008 [Nitrosopumilales archaeon]|nr:MAG: hypothetical protein NPMRTH1_120008 [Nitrosopumilales archaeon]
MARLRCKDHGFDCDFEVEGDDISKVIERFGNHTLIKHGKKYEKESLEPLIVGDICSCPYCNSKFESKELLSKHIDRIHHGSGVLEGDTRNL